MKTHLVRDRFLSVACGAVLFAFASSTALGQGGDVLVWATGNSDYDTPGVADYIRGSGHFDTVTALDSDDTQSLSTLLKYDAVLYFSNQSDGQDPDAIGDVLADYSDRGRRLVLATFSWAQQGSNTLGGRLLSDEISPFISEARSLYSNVKMASNDGSQLFDDVASLGGYYHDDVRLTTSAVANGTWDDGEVLVASKANVVAINVFPDLTNRMSGDYEALFANALRSLCLRTNATDVNTGDTLTFRTARGLPGGLALLAAIDINGNPLFARLDVGLFGANSERVLSSPVPPIIAGNTVTFLAIGSAKTGFAEATNPVVVTFN